MIHLKANSLEYSSQNKNVKTFSFPLVKYINYVIQFSFAEWVRSLWISPINFEHSGYMCVCDQSLVENESWVNTVDPVLVPREILINKESDWRLFSDRIMSAVRTLTFGDRKISYNEEETLVTSISEDKEESYVSSVYPCSDIDSGVGEDVGCDEHKDNHDNVVDNVVERKIIQPDVSTIRELTNFDEVRLV